MNKIIHTIDDPALLAAIEANFSEEMATFGRYLPGAELHEQAGLRWLYTSLPTAGFNAVLDTHVPTNAIDGTIESMIAFYQQRHVPFTWAVGPTTLPTNLGHYLKAHGFTLIRESTGMVVDMQILPEEVATPANFRVTEVRNLATLKIYTTTSMKGFGSTEEQIRIYFDTYHAIGFGADLSWQHYVGWLNDEPVAVSSLLLHAGVAGIYGIATVPEARRQGIGAAMTLAPLRTAQQHGYHIGVLSPSKMGLVVYQSLGFRTYCSMSFYRFNSSDQAS